MDSFQSRRFQPGDQPPPHSHQLPQQPQPQQNHQMAYGHPPVHPQQPSYHPHPNYPTHPQWLLPPSHVQQQPPPPPHPYPLVPPPYHGGPHAYSSSSVLPVHHAVVSAPLGPPHYHPYQQQHLTSPLPPSGMPHPPNQAWANPNWVQNQGWGYSDRNVQNEDDWAAKAKAWASAMSVPENPHIQPHVTNVSAEEGSYTYNSQYQPPACPPPEAAQLPGPPSTLHLSAQGTEGHHVQLSAPINHQELYTSNGNPPFGARDRVSFADKDETLPPRRNVVPPQSADKQEVSYSYSSATGSGVAFVKNEGAHMQPSTASADQFLRAPYVHLEVNSAAVLPHHNHEVQPSKPELYPNDGPLDLAPASGIGPHWTNHYNNIFPLESAAVAGNDLVSVAGHVWTPSRSGVFPQSLVPSPGSKIMDMSVSSQTSLPLHNVPIYGGNTGPNYRPNLLAAPFGTGAVDSLHHAEAFSSESNGSNLSERPKKAAVPKWLREEILKKKSTLSNSHNTDPSSVDTRLEIEKANLLDNRGDEGDSTKSGGDAEGDEDDVVAARAAAVNLEIKRVLTEVLMKVTDEIFEEIARRVLEEDDSTVDAANEPMNTQNSSRSQPALPTTVTAAKVLIPPGTSEVDGDDKSSLGSLGGNILGLANYTSDDDDEDNNENGAHPLDSRAKFLPTTTNKRDDSGIALNSGDKRELSMPMGKAAQVFHNGSIESNEIGHIENPSMELASIIDSQSSIQKSPKTKPEQETAELPSDVSTPLSNNVSDKTAAKEEQRSFQESRAAQLRDSSENDRQPGKQRQKEDPRETSSDKHESAITGTNTNNNVNSLGKKIDGNVGGKVFPLDRNAKRDSDLRSSGPGGGSKHSNPKEDTKDFITQDRRERREDDRDRKREHPRDGGEGWSRRMAREPATYRRSSPRGRSHTDKDSTRDGPSENIKKRYFSSITPVLTSFTGLMFYFGRNNT